MKISVIIPVYNTEKYLKECVESVLAQTYHNLEILLINDGATDSSPQICESYAKQDARIKLIHKENGGLSDTRNTGIKQCSGDYVLFLDSDDYWDDPKMVEKLADQMQQYPVDILNFRYKKYMEDTKQFVSCLKSVEDIKQQEKDQILECLINEGLYISSACNKLISASFLKTNELYFEKGITSEDIDWCARMLIKCGSIGYNNTEAYVYRQRSESITHTISYKNIYDLSNNVKKCVRFGQEIPKGTKFYELYHDFAAYQYGTLLLSNTLVDGDKDRIKVVMKEMKDYSWLLTYHVNPKIKLQYYVKKVVGYNNLIRFLKLYTKIKRY